MNDPPTSSRRLCLSFVHSEALYIVDLAKDDSNKAYPWLMKVALSMLISFETALSSRCLLILDSA